MRAVLWLFVNVGLWGESLFLNPSGVPLFHLDGRQVVFATGRVFTLPFEPEPMLSPDRRLVGFYGLSRDSLFLLVSSSEGELIYTHRRPYSPDMRGPIVALSGDSSLYLLLPETAEVLRLAPGREVYRENVGDGEVYTERSAFGLPWQRGAFFLVEEIPRKRTALVQATDQGTVPLRRMEGVPTGLFGDSSTLVACVMEVPEGKPPEALTGAAWVLSPQGDSLDRIPVLCTGGAASGDLLVLTRGSEAVFVDRRGPKDFRSLRLPSRVLRAAIGPSGVLLLSFGSFHTEERGFVLDTLKVWLYHRSGTLLRSWRFPLEFERIDDLWVGRSRFWVSAGGEVFSIP